MKFSSLADDCKASGYDSFAIDDFFEALVEQLDLLEANPSIEVLESQIFSDPSVDAYLIAFMRCCCGSYLKAHTEEFQPYVAPNFASLENFIRSEVDPMFRECDQLQVVALARAIDVPIKIVYLDRSKGTPTIHVFGNIDSNPFVAMLYRPGHYDLIYH